MSITGVKEIISDYALFYDNITCLSSLNVSGNTQLNNYTTINAPLYINTYQSTPPISALSVNCTSITNLVNIVQNAIWNESAKNYALNVTGYSNFGGIQINGQDNNHHIYIIQQGI
jgi:S-methylmethionine-dependent homocysteine/selenocysteine methylase